MLGMYGAFWAHALWKLDPFVSIVLWVPLGSRRMLAYRFLLPGHHPGGELNTLLYTAAVPSSSRPRPLRVDRRLPDDQAARTR